MKIIEPNKLDNTYSVFKMDNETLTILNLALKFTVINAEMIEEMEKEEINYLKSSMANIIKILTELRKDYKCHEIVSADKYLSELAEKKQEY